MKKRRFIRNWILVFGGCFFAAVIVVFCIRNDYREFYEWLPPISFELLLNLFISKPWRILIVYPILSYGFSYFEITDTELKIKMFPFITYVRIPFEKVVEAGYYRGGDYNNGAKHMYFAFQKMTDEQIYKNKQIPYDKRYLISVYPTSMIRVYEYRKKVHKYLEEVIGMEFLKR